MDALKTIGKIFAVFMSILYFFVFGCIVLLFPILSMFLDINFYKDALSLVDYNDFTISELGIEDNNLPDDVETLEDYIINKMSLVGISNDDAKEVLDNENIKDYVVNYVGNFAEYYLFDGEFPTINYEEVKEIIYKNNLGYIIEENNIDLNKYINIANEYIEENLPQKDEDSVYYSADIATTLVKISGIQTIVTFIVTSFAIIGLLTWSFYKPLLYLGIPTLCNGILFSLLYPLLNILSKNIDIVFLQNIINTFSKSFLNTGLICVGCSIFSIIVYSIINNKVKKKKLEERIANDPDSDQKLYLD